MNPPSEFPARWSWARFATFVWIAVTLAASIKLAAAPLKHSVFPVYLAGVDDWLQGKPVYVEREGLDLYRYPPPSLPMFALFKPFGLSVGSALWTLAGAGGLFAATEALRRRLLPGGTGWNDRQVAAYRLAVLLMAARSLWNAQSNTAVGALLIGGLALAGQRPLGGSLLFVLALFLKPTVLPIILMAGALKPRLAVLTATSALVSAMLLYLPNTEREATLWMQWIEHGRSSAGERRVAFRDGWTALVALEATARGTLPLLDSPYPRWWLPASAAWAVLALTCSLMLRKSSEPGGSLARAGLLGTAWLLLQGPAIEPPTYLLLGPWLGWSFASGIGSWLAAPALVGGIASLVLPGSPSMSAMAWAPALLPLSTALVAAWAVTTARARTGNQESSTC